MTEYSAEKLEFHALGRRAVLGEFDRGTISFGGRGLLLGKVEPRTQIIARLAEYFIIDEIGYLSYSSRHADLLFEIVSRCYQEKSTRIATNRPFAECGEVFPGAACVVSLVDRLVHDAEIIQIEGESYRLKEAKERSEQRRKQRAARKTKARTKPRSNNRS